MDGMPIKRQTMRIAFAENRFMLFLEMKKPQQADPSRLFF
jgi:hypothetical protein